MNKEEIIKFYKTLLPCEQFFITGSYALQRMGLVNKSDDIDIILVNPTDESKSIVGRLMDENPANTKPSTNKCEAIFIHEKTKIDIFFENKKEETLSVDGFEIRKADRIFEAKKRINRPKDWIQLIKISRSIVKSSEFNDYIDKI